MGTSSGDSPSCQELLAAGVEIPPGRRQLDRKAVIPQEVGDLAVGEAAGVGAKRAPARSIEAAHRFKQTDHRESAQVIEGMGGAAGKVAGDLVGEIEMRQRQGMYGGMGMDGR